jgi:hypothetical protein
MHGDTVGAKSLQVSVPRYRINRQDEKKESPKLSPSAFRINNNKRFLATMSSGDDRSGPQATNDKTSNSNNLSKRIKYNICTGYVLPQYRSDPDEIAALGRLPSAARTTAAAAATTTEHNTNTPRTNMGIQSQLQNGSIKACQTKKTAKHQFSGRNQIQLAIGGGEAFVEAKHCLICKLELDNIVAGYEKVRVPKRRHHTRCSRNGETKAKSRRSVQVERIARSNIALNNAPIDDLRRLGTSAAEKHTALFSQRMVTTEAATGKEKNRFCIFHICD